MTGTKSVYQRGLDAPVAGPNRRGDRRVAIIGAGACGICAAKYLIEVGFDVTVFEIGSQIGGMWCYLNDNGRSSAYRTLHINTSRGVTRFSDLDFDAQTQEFPDHADMHRYLVSYAEHFGVKPRIRFHSRVTQVRPAFDPMREAPRLVPCRMKSPPRTRRPRCVRVYRTWVVPSASFAVALIAKASAALALRAARCADGERGSGAAAADVAPAPASRPPMSRTEPTAARGRFTGTPER